MRKQPPSIEEAGFRAFEIQVVRVRDYFNFHQQLWTRGHLGFCHLSSAMKRPPRIQ